MTDLPSDAHVRTHLDPVGCICHHCGEVCDFHLPQPTTVVVAMINAFVGLHRYCPAPVAEPDEKETSA